MRVLVREVRTSLGGVSLLGVLVGKGERGREKERRGRTLAPGGTDPLRLLRTSSFLLALRSALVSNANHGPHCLRSVCPPTRCLHNLAIPYSSANASLQYEQAAVPQSRGKVRQTRYLLVPPSRGHCRAEVDRMCGP